MAAPAQSVNYFYGQKTRQDAVPPCKDVPVENGNNSRDGMNCEEDKQNTSNVGAAAAAAVTMDRSFQDGGIEQNSNMNNTRYPRNVDEQRINSDMNRFFINTSDANMASEDYGKVQESANQMSGYGNSVYNRTVYQPDQHGGPGPNSTDLPPNSSQNHMYSNYNQSPVRPVFNPNAKGMNMNSARSPVNSQNIAMNPQNYPPNQRFASGHNISQQSGPTPTLNQLLQNPNPVHRYQNNFNEFSGSSANKGNQDMNSGNHYAQQQWSGSRNVPGGGYPQQMSSPYRNQAPGVDSPGMKGQQPANWSSQGNYSQQQPQQMSPGPAGTLYNAAGGNSGGAPGTGSSSTSYPPQQRFPSQPSSQPGGPTPPPRTNSRGYPSQQGVAHYNQQPSPGFAQGHTTGSSYSPYNQTTTQPSYQNSRVSSPQRQQSPVPHSNSSQGSVPAPPPSTVPASSLSPSLVASHSSAPNSNVSSDAQQDLPGSLDDLSEQTAVSSPTVAATSSASPGQLASASSPSGPHQTASNINRPVPSPAPNTPTSRSMSPAVGNQNIPSSPRPSSVHSDTGSTSGSHHNQSPMPVSQQSNYHNQQPHVGLPNGPNSMGPPSFNSANKMPQQGMMTGNVPGGCPPAGQQGYPQGHYPGRGNGTPGNMAGGYGMPPNHGSNYNAAQYGVSMGNYGPRMNNHINQGGYPSGFGNQGAPPPGHYPPGYQGGSQTGAQAAQAAAQAAVMAAANSATPNTAAPSRTPHYLKQHLQQKMSGNGMYNQQQASPGQPPYIPGPPQAASPVGASQASNSTPLPPNSRMMSNSMPSSVHNSVPNSIIPSSGHNSLSNSLPGPATSAISSDGYPINRENSQPSSAAGPPPTGTSLTQSVSTPITTTSMANSDMPSNLPPPGGHDEASQHSIASTSSSQQEQDHTDNENSNPNKPKCYKDTISHPPTPLSTLPSPGAASMSSYHDEFENASSPSWPRTPASPVYNNQVYEHPSQHPPHQQHAPHPPMQHHPKRPDGLMKLYELSDDPERRQFLDKLIRFNEERGSPMTNGPTLSKQPLDLFKLYMCVKERGGFQEVTKSRAWKEISTAMNTGTSASTAYALRKQYIKHLLPFECKFDRGGIDHVPLIAQLESSSRKKKAQAAQAPVLANSQDPYHGGHGMDGYPPPGGYPPGQYGPGGPMPGQHMNAEYPPSNQNCPPGMMPNQINSDSISVQDPFSDDMQYQRNSYPQSQYGNNGPTLPPRGIQYHQPGYQPGSNIPDQYGGSSDPQQQYRRSSGGSMIQSDANMSSAPHGRNIPPQQQYPGGYQGGQYENRERFEQPQSGSMPPPPSNQQTPQQYPPQQQRYSSQPPPPPPSAPSSGPLAPPQSQDNSSFTPSNTTSPRPPYPTGHFNSHNSSNTSQLENQQPAPPPSSSGYQGPMQENYYQQQNYPNQQGYNQNTAASSKAAQQQQPQPPVPPGPPGPPGPPVPHGPGFQKREPYPASSYSMTPGSNTSTSSSKLLATITANRSGNSQQYPPPYPPNQFRGEHPPSSNQNDSNSNTPGWRENQYNQYGSPMPPGPGQQPTSREDWNSSRTPSNWSRYGNGPIQNGPVPPYPGNNANNAAQIPHGVANVPQNVGPFMQHRYNQQKMPPYKQDARFMQQQKIMPPAHPSAPCNNRREVIFPPDSIEMIQPNMIRRKVVSSKDLGSIEAWRILMALKSGLLTESTWALDALSVLLYDDSTAVYFSLRHLPGLLELVWEHYRRVISKIFKIADDIENICSDMGISKQRKLVLSDECKKLDEVQEYEGGPHHDDDYDKCDFGIVQGINNEDKIKILDVENYTMKSRNGKTVKISNTKDPFVCDTILDWDRLDNGFDCGYEHWVAGGGDTTFHIQTHFSLENVKNRFACRLKNVKKCHENEESDNSSSEKSCNNNKTCADIENVTNLECSVDNDDRTTSESVVNNRKRTIDEVSCIKEESVDEDEKILNCEDEKEQKEGSIDEDKVQDDADAVKPKYPRFRYTVPKRVHLDEFEEEGYSRDEPSLIIMTDTQEDLAKRCICLSNLIRNLSFIPGNDIEFSKHPGLLLLLGRLLLLHHNHFIKRPPQRNYDKDEDADFTDSCSSLHAEKEWWWDTLNVVRENTLVILTNIAGQLDLSCYPEDITLPILDGLLHWSICPSAYARDALPTMPSHSVLSPQRLSLETLCKICVSEANVDLLLATPPFCRIERLYSVLTKSLSKGEEPVIREFAVTLLSYFAPSDSSVCRIIAMQSPCISLLIGFIEQAEQNALQVANAHGINMLRENPEMMGTSLDMMRRAASTLLCLSRVPENRTLFVQYQSRLLTLVMSQILDQHVAGIISEILFECSLVDDGPSTS